MRLTQSALIVSSLTIATLTTVPAAHAADPAALAHASATAQTATGESMSDLRQEIDRLRLELAKKQADLDAALQRIKALESGTTTSTAPPAPATKPTPATTAAPKPLVRVLPPAPMPDPIPADPSIGPGGLQASSQADYLGAFPTVPSASDSKQLALHLRALTSWCAKANHEGTKQYIWVGRVDQDTVTKVGKNVSFMVTFVNSNKVFKVPVTVDQSLLTNVLGRAGINNGDLAFSGIVRPRLRVNDARPAPSVFEVPPMIAPYLEYFFSFNVKSIVPAAGAPR